MQQARPQMDVSADDVPAAIPPGFTGFVPPTAPTMQPQVAAAAPAVEPEAPARAPLRMFGALPPQMSAPLAAEPERSPLPSLVGSRAPALPVSAPAAPRGDEAPAAAAPPRPLSFGSLPAPTAPATTGSTNAAPAPAPSSPAAEPSLLDRIGDGLRNLNANGGGDLLTSLGIGLMSTPGFGRGAAAGLKAYQDNEGKRAASDLARAEFGLKVRKDAQEQRQLSGNAQYVASKIPGISPEQALTLGGNSTFMNELFKGVLPPSELYKQYTDADGNRWNRNERTGQETVALQARDDSTADQKNYEAAKKGGYEGSFTDFINFKGNASRAQTVVNNSINPILKGLGDQFVASADNARAGADQIRAIQNARAQLDGSGGIISGFRAGDRLALQKVGALLGVTDPDAIQNTESLRAALKPMVLAAVKGLGSNPSNGDRTFAEDFSGDNIALDEGSIRRILDLNERSARATISRHNALADQMLATQPDLKQVGPMMQVQAPEAQSAVGQRPGTPQGSETPAMGPLDQARAAIKAGADPNKVKTRLLKFGIDPRGL
ncbi:hypothetical protein [Methylobacterium sp. C1]|uniref:hypothetical protein n=1 Tax=Methylobacterium sp. C1 TaxID=1479019 RepID=UPI0013319677|nr:hypothetical protein [Methylobacterium sp. C1]